MPGSGPDKSSDLRDAALRDRFGLRTLRPLQRSVIDRVLAGGHALVVMPTGSGKSLCYQLPGLVLREAGGGRGVTLVFSPLIALMEDQVSALKGRGVRAEYVNSTVDRGEREKRYARLARGEYELFYATPERMTKPAFREAIGSVAGGVRLLAIDEAHCISKWGHDLRPAYREVGRFRAELGSPTTIALTATATPQVRSDIRETLGFDEVEMPLFAAPLDRPNLALHAEEAWDDGAKLAQLTAVCARNPGTAIAYFALIKDLERLVPEAARATGRAVEVYHGRLSPRDKRRVYRRFIDAAPDHNLLLLATNAFGMGVDKPDLRAIVHMQIPGSVEAYHQEVGRAGRDGAPAECLLLLAQDDVAIQHTFAEWASPPADLLIQASAWCQVDQHHDFDAEDFRLGVFGKGRGEGFVDYTLIDLERRGVIERTPHDGRWRFVRPLDDSEVDPGEIAQKRERDLRRLLDVVTMARSGDIAGFVRDYFALGAT